MEIDATGIHYRELNKILDEAVTAADEVTLIGVNGQRYIGTRLRRGLTMHIHGTPGNDLGSFMDGPTIIVHGNAQDGVANTMNSGRIIVHGSAGDILGYGMRGGEVFVQGDVGYRVGIHMKEYRDKMPVIVIGGCAGDFFGEYIAGGRLILLGLNRESRPIVGNFCGTGMHGGVIFLRGTVAPHRLGAEVGVSEPDADEVRFITDKVKQFCEIFHLDWRTVMKSEFVKLFPRSARPYGNLYAY